MQRSIWIGFDPREADAFAVARHSILRRLTWPIPIKGLVLDVVRGMGMYRRPHEVRDGRLWCPISEAHMSTEFAVSRFLTPHLARSGWALFCDADVMARGNLARLFELADPSKAVMVVKHDHRPAEEVKMDGQAQAVYPRKNWSSVMLFNCDHPANKALTVDQINQRPGRDLHAFCWLADCDIGALPVEWNWLAGYSPASVDPQLVHFTDGVPSMPGYETAPYADEWRAVLRLWAA